MPDGSPESRWAAQTVDEAARVGSLRGLVACSVILAAAVVVSDTSWPLLPLLICHGLYGLGAMTVLWRGWDVRVALVGLYLLLLGDFVVSAGPTEPLAVATVWIAWVTTGTPAVLLRGFQAALLPFGASLAMAATLGLLRPDWGTQLPLALILGTLALWPAGLMFRRALDALVVRTDDQEAAVERERRRLVVVRTAERELAEDARVLHDSVINTLAAIASQGAWAGGDELVRRQCRRDVRTVENLLAGRRNQPLATADPRDAGIRVRRTGLRDDEFEHHAALLSVDLRSALAGAVDELIRNAAKHAETSEAVVDLRRRDDELIATVSDHGVGFDGVLIAGRGLAESVVRRVESVGGRVEIETSPGMERPSR